MLAQLFRERRIKFVLFNFLCELARSDRLVSTHEHSCFAATINVAQVASSMPDELLHSLPSIVECLQSIGLSRDADLEDCALDFLRIPIDVGRELVVVHPLIQR